MTEQEYINSIPPETWHDAIQEVAYREFARLMAAGGLDVAQEEFNNDVYDQFVDEAIDQGSIGGPDEEQEATP